VHTDLLLYASFNHTRTQGGRGKGGESGWLQPPSQNQNLKKNADFVDTTIYMDLHDLLFSLNQPLKSADD